MKIGTVIKDLRKSKRIKQKELAAKLGISNAYLSSIENNKKEPSMDLTKEIATQLGVPLYYFFIKAYDEKSLTGKQKKVFVKARSLIDEFLKIQAKNEKKN
jgi:transcriptional regulator with XRE-family HTH domain